jgi:CBS domain-containing protein
VPHAPQRSVLSGVRVESAMRRQVVRGLQSASLSACINQMIKHKVGALLIVDGRNRPVGVLSKTDLISAYYAQLPVDTPVGDIVAGAPAFCYPDDLLEEAIDHMQAEGIHRIYVRGAHIEQIVGTLSYLDVVGLLYRYCRNCRNSVFRPRQEDPLTARRLQVREVMSSRVHSARHTSSLGEIIETLTSSRCGAALLVDGATQPAGVISKTDLVLAYKHGRPIGTPAADIMQHPVLSCRADSLLADALQQMLIRDVQRLFVRPGDAHRIVGVLSLSDSARFRSGSCRACMPSRLLADDPPLH